MSNTLISDVIVPGVYAGYTAVDSPEKSAFFDSGVAISSPKLNQEASTGGNILTLPFWKDLDGSSEPNYSSDSVADVATPEKIVAGEQIARNAYMNKGYSSADLSGELAGSSPMQRVRDRFGAYWSWQWQRRAIASVKGVLADNIANDDSDMVNDISGATNADIATGTLFSREAFTAAAFTSGDRWDDYSAIAVHSMVAKRMVDNDDIDYIADSQGNLTIPTYMGRRVIVDDGMPYTPAAGALGTDAAPFYTSILFGAGSIGFGEGSPKMPVEIERVAGQGGGGGIETLWERKTWVIHPFGTKFTSTTVTGETPSWANLALATNWDRVVDRKQIPLAFIISNG